MKRRQFITQAATISLACSLPRLSIAQVQRPASFRGGWYVSEMPDSPEYLEATELFNPRIQIRPKLIASVSDVNDVSTAVHYARKQGMRIAIRGAGHSYEGLSLGPDLVIDTRALQSISMNSEGVLRLGAGCRFRQIADYLAPSARAIAFGSCPGVGVAGYTLGGGISLLSRSIGLNCDLLKSVELVDARGRLLTASTNENSELFWGLRGGGAGQFGVITALEFQTVPVPEVVLFRRVYGPEQAPAALHEWQEWAPSCDPRVGSHATIRGGAKGSLRLGGIFNGSLAEWNRVRTDSPFSEAKRTEDGFDKASSLIDAMRYFGGSQRVSSRANSPFQSTSDYIKASLTRDWQSRLLELLKASPFATILLDSLGGRIDDVPATDSAYVHRLGNRILAQATAYQSKEADEAKVGQWLRAYRQDFGRSLSGYAYQNYPDAIREDWATAFYGENLGRLRQLKQYWDPDRLFSHRCSF
jgi:FAD/FMN-containing dehydrogenase